MGLRKKPPFLAPEYTCFPIFLPQLQANRSICFTSLLLSPFSSQKDDLRKKMCQTIENIFWGKKQYDYRNSLVCLPPLSLLIHRSLIREDLMYSIHKKAETSNKICSVPFSSCFINKEQNVSRLSVTYAQSDFKPDWDAFQMRIIIYSSNNNAFFYCFACKVVPMFY